MMDEKMRAAFRAWHDSVVHIGPEDIVEWTIYYLRCQQEPVAAQHRFRSPQKTRPNWSIWQPCAVANRPPREIDNQGYEVEYRNLYAAPVPAAQPEQITPKQLGRLIADNPDVQFSVKPRADDDEEEMMDEKMRKAYEAWWEKRRNDASTPTDHDIIEWTLDYLRSQQEPEVWCNETWVQEAKRGYPGYVVGEPQAGFDLPLYTHPVLSTPAVPEWQPIETAPNEGWFLVHSEKGWIGVACRSDPDHAPDEGWFEDEHTEFIDPAWLTHWMPLPAAPSNEEKEG